MSNSRPQVPLPGGNGVTAFLCVPQHIMGGTSLKGILAAIEMAAGEGPSEDAMARPRLFIVAVLAPSAPPARQGSAAPETPPRQRSEGPSRQGSASSGGIASPRQRGFPVSRQSSSMDTPPQRHGSMDDPKTPFTPAGWYGIENAFDEPWSPCPTDADLSAAEQALLRAFDPPTRGSRRCKLVVWGSDRQSLAAGAERVEGGLLSADRCVRLGESYPFSRSVRTQLWSLAAALVTMATEVVRDARAVLDEVYSHANAEYKLQRGAALFKRLFPGLRRIARLLRTDHVRQPPDWRGADRGGDGVGLDKRMLKLLFQASALWEHWLRSIDVNSAEPEDVRDVLLGGLDFVLVLGSASSPWVSATPPRACGRPVISPPQLSRPTSSTATRALWRRCGPAPCMHANCWISCRTALPRPAGGGTGQSARRGTCRSGRARLGRRLRGQQAATAAVLAQTTRTIAVIRPFATMM